MNALSIPAAVKRFLAPPAPRYVAREVVPTNSYLPVLPPSAIEAHAEATGETILSGRVLWQMNATSPYIDVIVDAPEIGSLCQTSNLDAVHFKLPYGIARLYAPFSDVEVIIRPRGAQR